MVIPVSKPRNVYAWEYVQGARQHAFPSDGETKSYPCVKTEICLCQNVLHTQMKNLSG